MAGNSNSGRRQEKLWRDALLLEVNRPDKLTGEKPIAVMARQLVSKAMTGDVTALKEVGDRLDGKPPQAIEGSSEAPLTVVNTIRLAGPDD